MMRNLIEWFVDTFTDRRERELDTEISRKVDEVVKRYAFLQTENDWLVQLLAKHGINPDGTPMEENDDQ